MLAEGKVVVIVQGSPFALVLPSTAADLIEASEDNYVRVPEANFMRLVRLLGMALSLLLPGLFVALMLYHHEVIPTDLLLAIEASREKVPFPLVAELLLMELSFELIKEASVRVPSPVGSTLGIIGGLILGQAAVEANIVSPILIIIVSITGLGTFVGGIFPLPVPLPLFLYSVWGVGGDFGNCLRPVPHRRRALRIRNLFGALPLPDCAQKRGLGLGLASGQTHLEKGTAPPQSAYSGAAAATPHQPNMEKGGITDATKIFG